MRDENYHKIMKTNFGGSYILEETRKNRKKINTETPFSFNNRS